MPILPDYYVIERIDLIALRMLLLLLGNSPGDNSILPISHLDHDVRITVFMDDIENFSKNVNTENNTESTQ